MRIARCVSGGRRVAGVAIVISPLRYLPVIDAGFAHDLVDRARGDDFAAVLARARTEIDDVVRGAHRLLVVLDDDHGVAEIAQLLERGEQPRVVALMQADRRLVEDVEHADQPRADLRRQTNALRLAAGQRFGRATQREIVEPDVDEKTQPLAHFLEDRVRRSPDRARARRRAEPECLEERQRVGDRQLDDLADVPPCTVTDERFALEPAAAAVAARHLDHVLLQLHANGVGLRLVVAPLDVARARLPTRRRPRLLRAPASRLSPCRIASRTRFGRSPHGVLRSNLS